MITYTRASTEIELLEILRLQQQNLYDTVSFEERKKEGFVTVSHTLELLTQMNDTCPHIIAKASDTIVGYALCMHPKFGNSIAVLRPMFAEIDLVHPATEPFMAMGQICIDKNYRGQGVFRQLYETMKIELQSDYSSIITEVDAENTRSLGAHYAVGFSNLKTYLSDNREWKLLALKTR